MKHDKLNTSERFVIAGFSLLLLWIGSLFSSGLYEIFIQPSHVGFNPTLNSLRDIRDYWSWLFLLTGLLSFTVASLLSRRIAATLLFIFGAVMTSIMAVFPLFPLELKLAILPPPFFYWLFFWLIAAPAALIIGLVTALKTRDYTIAFSVAFTGIAVAVITFMMIPHT